MRHDHRRFDRRMITALALGATLIAACGAQDEAAQRSESLLARCSGTYSCNLDEPVETELHREGDHCLAGEVELRPDGEAVVGGGFDTRWEATAAGFDICLGDDCITCSDGAGSGEDAPAAAGGSEGEGECSGSSESCWGQVSCSAQRGCLLGVHVRWDGSTEMQCKGVAWPCSDFDSAQSCKSQRGCWWRAR